MTICGTGNTGLDKYPREEHILNYKSVLAGSMSLIPENWCNFVLICVDIVLTNTDYKDDDTNDKTDYSVLTAGKDQTFFSEYFWDL